MRKYKYLLFLPLVILLVTHDLFGGLSVVGKGKGRGMGKRRGGRREVTCKGEKFDMKQVWKFKAQCGKEIFGHGWKGYATTSAPQTDAEPETTPSSSGGKGKHGFGKRHKEMLVKQTCATVCLWKKQNLLTDDGKFNSNGLDEFMTTYFPEKSQADMKQVYLDCNSSFGESFNMDNNCEGYKPFKDCTYKKFHEVCGTKKGKRNKGGHRKKEE